MASKRKREVTPKGSKRVKRNTQDTQHELQPRRPTRHLQAPQLLPDFIYRIGINGELCKTSLITGKQKRLFLRDTDLFTSGFCVNEVHGANLLFTGGDHSLDNSVTRIDTRREFAFSRCPAMLSARQLHAAVYHDLHLYVVGGRSTRCLRKCERYVCEENLWEALRPLPIACCHMSAVVIEKSLYALGGQDGKGNSLDLVQRLSFEGLTWETLQFRLPLAGFGIPCFKVTDTEVYLVVNKTLCEFTALNVRPLKTLTVDIPCLHGASYYDRGILYCFQFFGAARSFEIGSL